MIELCKSLEYKSPKKEFSTSIATIAATNNKIPGAVFNLKNFLIISIGIFCFNFEVINGSYDSIKSPNYIFWFPKVF